MTSMTEDAAAWVRANVWTQQMRKTHGSVPKAAGTCACQSGPSQWCAEMGRHELCQRGTPLRSPETYITTKTDRVVSFAELYEHPSVSATGARRVSYAMVWLADRACRWVCPCECGHAGPPSALWDSDRSAEGVEGEAIELRSKSRIGYSGTVNRVRASARDSVPYKVGDNQETLF